MLQDEFEVEQNAECIIIPDKITGEDLNFMNKSEISRMVNNTLNNMKIGADKKQLETVLTVIRYILPDVESDSDVDDLLYPNDDLTLISAKLAGKRICRKPLDHFAGDESQNYELNFEKFLKFYEWRYDHKCRLLDSIYIQWLDYEVGIYAENYLPSKYSDKMGQSVREYACQRIKKLLNDFFDPFEFNFIQLCKGLKELQVYVKRMNSMDDSFQYMMIEHLTLYASKLKEIPDKCRITSFIRKQASIIYEECRKVTLKICNDSYIPNFFYGMPVISYGFVNTEKFRQSKRVKFLEANFMEIFDAKFIEYSHQYYEANNILKHGRVLHFDILHKFFATAKNEKQIHQRLKDFLDGNYRGFKYNGKCIEPYHYLIAIVNESSKFLDDVAELIVYKEDKFKCMDRLKGCNDEPCLSLHNNNQVYSEENYLYDAIMKCLDVLSILNTAFHKRREFHKKVGSAFSESEIFRSENSFIMKYINKALIDPSKRSNKIPWLIEITMKKCPFLVFPAQREHMVEDLLKMLKGENIDEVSEEQLFFNLTVPRGFKDQFIVHNPYMEPHRRYDSMSSYYKQNINDMIDNENYIAKWSKLGYTYLRKSPLITFIGKCLIIVLFSLIYFVLLIYGIHLSKY